MLAIKLSDAIKQHPPEGIMFVDDRRTHTDHVGVRQQPCFAILCFPYASSGCNLGGLQPILNNFMPIIYGPQKNEFSAVFKVKRRKADCFFYILTVAGNWGAIGE